MQDEKRYDISEVKLRPSLLTVVVFPDSGRYVAKCIELDLITEMDTPEEAAEAVVEMLKEYAEDYHSREEMFVRSPNRSHHKPYVDALLRCKTDWDIQELLEIRYGRLHIRPVSASIA
jgi:hypothetical protein